jgi:tetratricopeptide (TPR) repeat protein
MKRILISIIGLAAASLALAQAPPPKAGKGVSKAAAQAIQTMVQAQSPDDRIAAAENVINKFAELPAIYKSMAFYVEADSYTQKNDSAKATVFAEQAIAADPKNYDATVLLANVISTGTRDTDLDKDEKVARVTKLSNDTIEGLKTAEKPNPQMTEDQWKQYKATDTAQAYQALGNIAIAQKKYDDAVKNFQAGIDADPADPLLMIRAGRALLAIKKYDDAIGMFDKAISVPGVPDQIKNIATSDKARATAAKGK